MKFVIDGEEPKEEICKVSLQAGYAKGSVRIVVASNGLTFTLATLRDGKIYLDSGFDNFHGIKSNRSANPLVVDSHGDLING